MLTNCLTSQSRSIYFLLNWYNTIHVAAKTNKNRTNKIPSEPNEENSVQINFFVITGGSFQQFLSSGNASHNFTDSVAILIEILHFAALLKLSLLNIPYTSAVQQQK